MPLLPDARRQATAATRTSARETGSYGALFITVAMRYYTLRLTILAKRVLRVPKIHYLAAGVITLPFARLHSAALISIRRRHRAYSNGPAR